MKTLTVLEFIPGPAAVSVTWNAHGLRMKYRTPALLQTERYTHGPAVSTWRFTSIRPL